MAPPTLYVTRNVSIGPCIRSILMTAKYLDLELIEEDIDEVGETRDTAFFAMDPQYIIPTFNDDGFIMWESYAILTYLVDKYGKDDSLYPKDVQKRATVDERLHFVNGVLNQRIAAVVTKQVSEKADEPDQKLLDSLHEAYDFLETCLDEGFVAGSALTVADFATGALLGVIHMLEKIDEKKWPKVSDWLKKMDTLPLPSECK